MDHNNGDVEAAFKNCTSFRKCITHINDGHIDDANDLELTMPMYNLKEYSDNFSDNSGSLWQFKRDEQNMINGNPGSLTTDNSPSFK